MRRDFLVEESDSDTDRWMISYADFITLLFAFFVVMYAISSVNDDKYRVLSDTLAEAFAGDPSSIKLIQVGQPSQSASPHVVDIPDTEGWADQQYGDTFMRDVGDQATPLGGFAAQEGVAVEVSAEWLELNLGAEILFQSGQTELLPAAVAELQPLIELLLQNQNPITIEGYTDNVPPVGGRFPSNWELSGGRAAAIARFLVERGIRQERIAAIGYGENHPLETNATPGGRAVNNRVSVIVARRSSLARNRNADVGVLTPPIPGAVVSHIRNAEREVPKSRRKADGGLIFTDESSQVLDDDERTE